MKKINFIIGASALAILIAGVSAVSAFNGSGRSASRDITSGFNRSVAAPDQAAWQARHEAMQKAFENNDYNAWKNLMASKGRVLDIINEQNFPKFAKMHKLMLEGKIDEANIIRQELGLGVKGGGGRGMMGGRGCRMPKNIAE